MPTPSDAQPAAAMSTKTQFCGCIHWILDWDCTLTLKDTLDTLVGIAAANNPRSSTLEQWKRITQAYLHDHKATLEQLAPDGMLPTTVDNERKLLKTLEDVERRSLDRVFESTIFKGLAQAQIESGARKAIELGQVQLRQGLPVFLKNVQVHEAQIHILSVNWSRRFISAGLEAAGVEFDQQLILSNELEGFHEGRPSTGRIGPAENAMIISSADKLRSLEQLRFINMEFANPTPIVYVGDSWTDIECLLAADLGICIRDDPMLSSQKTLALALERLSIQCPHLTCWTECGERRVVWVKDFTELGQESMLEVL